MGGGRGKITGARKRRSRPVVIEDEGREKTQAESDRRVPSNIVYSAFLRG